MQRLITHIKRNILLYLLIVAFGSLFFYRLDYNTLASWDEAWYASISRQMVRTGEYMNMVWNGKPYIDHPPLGYWFMAGSYRLFGINEFSTRLPSALLGVGSVVLMYVLATAFFKRKAIGIASALMLGTSVWYVLRVRSGNLDSIFIFFYLFTVYLAYRSSKNILYLPLTALSFSALMLSKTLVGASAIVIIVYLNAHHLKKLKQNLTFLLGSVIIFLIAVLPWYTSQADRVPNFYSYHFLNIGFRQREVSSLFDFAPAKQALFFLHMGVRKWYWIWTISLGWLVARFFFIKDKKQTALLMLWNGVVLFPFLSSQKTEIWHLIPVFPPLALITAYAAYDGVYFTAELAKRYAKGFAEQMAIFTNPRILTTVYLLGFILLAGIQVKIFFKEVMPENRYTKDDVDISRRLAKYNAKIFLDDDFFPRAVYYSGGKRIIPIYDAQSWGHSEDKKSLLGVFQADDEPEFIAVTRNWVLDNLDKDGIKYKLLEQNDSYSIITRK
ncbi:MAG: ArnT family glycosyltransferase [Candidatus Paceibacterota bacterium]